MNIQEILKDEKKKKFLIIGVIAFFIILILSLFLLNKTPAPQIDNSQLLSDIGLLAPRDTISKNPNLKQAPIITVSVDKPEIAPGQTALVSWNATNATSCSNEDGDTLETSGSFSVSPSVSRAFDVLCTGPNGTDIQSVTVSVTTGPIIRLSASPTSVLSGKTSIVSWTTENADRCVDGSGATARLSGSFSISPKTPYSFSLSCTNKIGEAKKSIAISIAKPAPALATTDSGSSGSGSIWDSLASGVTSLTSKFNRNTLSALESTMSLSATPLEVEYMGSSKISWTVDARDSCVFTSDGDLHGVTPIPVFPASHLITNLSNPGPQTYTLSCARGEIKASEKVTINVGAKPEIAPAKIEGFAVDGNDFAATGDPITLVWSTTGVKNCTIKSRNIEASGDPVTKRTYPSVTARHVATELYIGKYEYSLECTSMDPAQPPTKNPPLILTFIDCSINGNTVPADPVTEKKTTKGVVMKDPRETPPTTPICTYTYKGAKGTGIEFAKIFGMGVPNTKGLAHELRYCDIPAGTNVPLNLPRNVAPRDLSSIQKSILCAYNAYRIGHGGWMEGPRYDRLYSGGRDEKDLCKWRFYTEKTIGGNLISKADGYFDTEDHSNWTYVDSRAQTKLTSCKTHYTSREGDWGTEYDQYHPTQYGLSAWDGDKFVSMNYLCDASAPGLPNDYSVEVVNSLTCEVKPNNPKY